MGSFPELSRREYLQTQPTSVEPGCEQTRRVYDAVAPLYSLSSRIFHSRAHAAALSVSGIQNGTRILEVATGSGEMLTRLAKANPRGKTVGVDFSPKMAALSQVTARAHCPDADVHCQAADGRSLPFPSASFDTVVCCFLFELLPEQDVPRSLAEVTRVLRPGGRMVVTLVGQNKSSFNALYRLCTRFAPSFWGQQRSAAVATWLDRRGYRIEDDYHVGQLYYSSRIMAATRPA